MSDSDTPGSNGKPLNNLQELTDYLPAFTGEEGLWVASWLEYLGDAEVAGMAEALALADAVDGDLGDDEAPANLGVMPIHAL